MSFCPPPLDLFSLEFYDISKSPFENVRLPVLPKVALEERGVVVVGLGGGSGSIPSIDPQNLEQPQEMLDSTRKYWLLESSLGLIMI